MSRRRRQKNIQYIIARAFAICFTLVIILSGFLYWRQQTVNNERLRQAQLEKEQSLQSKEKFIKVVAPIAQRSDKPYGLFPSVTIAQACLESNFGQSELSRKYNNLFGVKGMDPNTSRELTTSEFVNDHWETVTGRFRVYDTYEESIEAHTRLFVNGTTWNRKQYQHVLAAKDYATQAQALETDGYATDPGYAKKLIDIIKEFNLTQYD